MGSESVVLGDSVPASVLTSVADFYVVLSPSGKVKAAVAKPETMASDEVAGWVSAPLAGNVDESSARKLNDRLDELKRLAADGRGQAPLWVELMHEYSTGQRVPVRYAMHWRPDDGDVLMLGQDQRPVIEMQQQLLNAQIALERDYEAQREIDTRYRILMDFTSDAILLVAMASGHVVDVNHNAAAMLGVTRTDLVDKPLSECFPGFRKEDLATSIGGVVRRPGLSRSSPGMDRGAFSFRANCFAPLASNWSCCG